MYTHTYLHTIYIHTCMHAYMYACIHAHFQAARETNNLWLISLLRVTCRHAVICTFFPTQRRHYVRLRDRTHNFSFRQYRDRSWARIGNTPRIRQSQHWEKITKLALLHAGQHGGTCECRCTWWVCSYLFSDARSLLIWSSGSNPWLRVSSASGSKLRTCISPSLRHVDHVLVQILDKFCSNQTFGCLARIFLSVTFEESRGWFFRKVCND